MPAAATMSSEEEARLLARASKGPDASPFDYIIVGSGAGGGPLAARLALAGRCVLVIEAGGDPAEERSVAYPDAEPGEVYACPGYHGAATEDRELSWQFSVRHYADDARQAQDEKYNQHRPPDPRFFDPAATGGRGRGGVFYPRSAGLGGCTGHHAMIVVAPNDRDWNHIADVTGDESWRPARMRGYFARLERCLYRQEYQRWLKRLLGFLYWVWQRLVLLFDPRAVLDEGGHGSSGWQPTTFIDPNLIEGIARRDRGFTSVLTRAALAVLHDDNRLIAMLKRALVWLRVVQHIDPNDLNTRRTSPEGVFLIPTGIESGDAVDENGKPLLGRRVGVREFLLRTRAEHPDRLVLKQRTHVTRILFAATQDGPPAAIGIEAAEGAHLYEASPLRQGAPEARVRYFARREVILCGGAFNTPQLLMLSGIGEAAHLAAVARGAGDPDACTLRDATGRPLRSADGGVQRIDLAGVGRNLQDRYEVSVISELATDFATLDKVSFTPGDPNDPVRREWLDTKSGLYRTNGGTLAVLRRSSALAPTDAEPDLFVFGVPAAFRGYYFGYSTELLRRTLGAPEEQRNLWSWVILKAYTRNDAGRVRLRSDDPFAQPEICFDSFNEYAEAEGRAIAAEVAHHRQIGTPVPADLTRRAAENAAVLADSERDLDALVDAVAFMRSVNARNPERFVDEIQPGPARVDGSDALKEWIRTQAWGHHASCTCRMGSDEWRGDPEDLDDGGAVLDSRFRVHGVRGLRVVDASVFPSIPGYFILTPILMVSEKAADVLLEDAGDSVYPAAFRKTEVAAVYGRRAAALARADEPPVPHLPPETVGLALSGGGIRSATFGLGILQALAEKGRLRDVDFLSTVSGGGFIGSFLGRLFTREAVTSSADPVGRVQATLADSRSAPLWWLRTQANYIFASGSADLRYNLAIFWRNIFSVHLVVGALLFALFGVLALGARQLGWEYVTDAPSVDVAGWTLIRSPWWWTPLPLLVVAVLPATLAYWLSPRPGSYRPYPLFALTAWLLLVGGSLWLLQMGGSVPYGGAALVVLVLAWGWQEVARWGNEPERELRAARQRCARARRRGGRVNLAELRQKEAEARRQVGTIVRNRLTRALGDVLVIFAGVLSFVLLDSIAVSVVVLAKEHSPVTTLTMLLIGLGPLLPFLRGVGVGALRQISGSGLERLSLVRVAKLLGIPLALFLVWVVDVFAHRLVMLEPSTAGSLVLLAIVVSLAIGRAFDFLNTTTLRAGYAARLARTFLGASNPARVYRGPVDDSADVQAVHPGDDLPHDQYHPEEHGGPIHLINVCINETVDVASEREVRERKGISMCVTPHGVVVGRRYFAEWAPPDELPRWQRFRRWRDGLDADDGQPAERRRRVALKALPFLDDPNAFHVLKSRSSEAAEVEPLSLATWTAISGAAFSTGTGRTTTLPLSLFMGLLNIRLGYWWDTGIRPQERPGRYLPPLWRRIKRLPSRLFSMQSMLLAEWTGRFRGPSQWFWQLSDGGHFDVTGLYELLRRRVPFAIVIDAGEDPDYHFGDLAQLTRQVRQDFGAKIDWDGRQQLPDWISDWVEAGELGRLEDLRRDGARHAAMGYVEYPGAAAGTWILLIKPGVDPRLTSDVGTHAVEHHTFPQDSTFDQVFDDVQWESYRALGQQIGRRVLRGR